MSVGESIPHQDADLRAGLKYLWVDDEIRRTLDPLAPPDGTAQLSAVRMFRPSAPGRQQDDRARAE